jgi:hypothetical protein
MNKKQIQQESLNDPLNETNLSPPTTRKIKTKIINFALVHTQMTIIILGLLSKAPKTKKGCKKSINQRNHQINK